MSKEFAGRAGLLVALALLADCSGSRDTAYLPPGGASPTTATATPGGGAATAPSATPTPTSTASATSSATSSPTSSASPKASASASASPVASPTSTATGTASGTGFTVTTIAGNGVAMSIDGTGTDAEFSAPLGIAYDAGQQGAPTLFITDFNTGFVRGMNVTTRAVVTYDSVNFTAQNLFGAAINSTGTTGKGLYVVASGDDYSIVLPTTPNPSATPDHIGQALGTPDVVALDGQNDLFNLGASDGNFYEIVNSGALLVRTQLSSTFPNSGNYGLVVTGTPGSAAYFTDLGTNTLYSATTTQMMAAATPLKAGAPLNAPAEMTMLGGNLYIANCGGNDILKATTAGAVTIVAGSGVAGEVDGANTGASFNCPFGIANDGTNLYVTDMNGNTIRKITNVS